MRLTSDGVNYIANRTPIVESVMRKAVGDPEIYMTRKD